MTATEGGYRSWLKRKMFKLIRYYFNSAWLPFTLLLSVGVLYRVLVQLPAVMASPSAQLDVEVSCTLAAVAALAGVGAAAVAQWVRGQRRKGLLNLGLLVIGGAPFWMRWLGI